MSGITVLFTHAAVFAAALLFCAPSRAADATYMVKWRTDERNTNSACVEVSGISAAALRALKSRPPSGPEWSRLLSVYVHDGGAVIDPLAPGMVGQYAIEGEVLRFRPQFPLARGVEYRAEFRPGALPGGKPGQLTIVARHRVAKPSPTESTVVTMIYPTAEVLPENLLKFYVYFSAPMSRGDIYDHIKLREDSGREIELPFLQIDEELWDAEMKRLTLFIDPGRIKRGVLPLEEVGPSLEAGKKYELTIAEAWKDAAGNPLKAKFQKRFAVGEPDRAALDSSQWKVTAPKSTTAEPLTVDFGKSVDHALALRLIEVVRDGHTIQGKRSVTQNERVWQFVPGEPWRAGPYHLAVQTTIEDLAGNNIGKPFEVDLFDGVQRRLTNSVVKIPFEIR
jgi:hypothetical protein